MQIVYVSVVVYDSSDLRISISTDQDALRRDLIELYNDNLDDDEDPLPDDATLDEIRDVLPWPVVVEENCVWHPRVDEAA